MIAAQFIYQRKAYHDTADWEDISDMEFMDELYMTFNRLSPVVKRLLSGEEIHANGVAYRIKEDK